MGQISSLENISSSGGPELSPFSGTRSLIQVFTTAHQRSNQFSSEIYTQFLSCRFQHCPPIYDYTSQICLFLMGFRKKTVQVILTCRVCFILCPTYS